MLNWLAAIGIVVFAIGFVLLLLGMPQAARYGTSTVFDVGFMMMLAVVVIGGLIVAGMAVFYLVTQQPIQLGIDNRD